MSSSPCLRGAAAVVALLMMVSPPASVAGAPAGEIPELVRAGTGPVPMLLIPCMSCRWNSWEEFMERNAERYSMHAVTLPGFGGTPVPELPLDTGGTPWRDNAVNALVALVDREGWSELVVVGHSWGTMLAVQLAARRPDKVRALVAVDGSIESTTWTPADPAQRLAEARQVGETWGPRLALPDEWHRFNGGHLPGAAESFTRDEVRRELKRFGAFMATPRHVVLQYWRENLLIDLTADLKRLDLPILDVKALRGGDQEDQRRAHLRDAETAGVPEGVRHVFLYDTRHFVMHHRPEVLDALIRDFLAGQPVGDFRPR